MPAMSRLAPPRNSRIVRFSRLMRWYRLTAMIPAIVEKKVASRIGTNTSVGCAAPICARYTMMLMGISVSPDVFSTKNMIIGLLAVSFRGFSSCSPSMAFRPSGVAALSSPSIFAARFMKILPVTGCPFGISGNSFENSGLSRRAKSWITPPLSPIFMMPSQSDNTPVSPNEISNAVLEEAKVELIISGNTAVSPKNTSLTSATTKARRKNAIQM